MKLVFIIAFNHAYQISNRSFNIAEINKVKPD